MYYGQDVLEASGPLTEQDYKYLKGEKTDNIIQWDTIVAEWCRNQGYGEFGRPTESGKKAIVEYV